MQELIAQPFSSYMMPFFTPFNRVWPPDPPQHHGLYRDVSSSLLFPGMLSFFSPQLS